MKLAQPLGAFKAFWAELETNKEKIGRIHSADDSSGTLQRIKKQEREASVVSTRFPTEEENKLICQTSPQARFSPFLEPLTMVENYTEQPKTEGGKHRLWLLQQRMEAAQANWSRNGGPDQFVAIPIRSDPRRTESDGSL